MGELNIRRLVAAAGAAQTLTGAGDVDPVYEITLSAASCAITLEAQATAPVRMQTITAYFKQDATGGRAVVLPSGILWSEGFLPILSQAAKAVNIIQFTTFDGVTWYGFLQATKMLAASIVVQNVSAGAPGNNVTVSGIYQGTPPGNLAYSFDDAAYVTLGAGVATILNGTFSFPIPAPGPAGNHTVKVRAIGTGSVSDNLVFVVSAASGPTAVSATASNGNASNTVNATGTANGSPITSFAVFAASAVNGTYAQVGVATPTTTPNSGVTTASFNHTGLTNDTAYFYKVKAVTAVEEITSAAVGPITPSAAPAMPSAPVPVVRIEADTAVASDGKGGSKVTNQGSWAGDWSNPTASVAGPALVATGWGGSKPTLAFIADRWLQPETARNWPSGTAPFTLMAMVSFTQIATANTIFGSGLQGGGQLRSTDDNRAGFNRAGQAEINKSPVGQFTVNNRYIIVFVFDGTNTIMRVNKVAQTNAVTSVVAPNLGAQMLNIGHNGSAGTGNAEDMRGNISAALMFTTALATADIQAWENYLTGKWPL